jgi:hypothetical protein
MKQRNSKLSSPKGGMNQQSSLSGSHMLGKGVQAEPGDHQVNRSSTYSNLQKGTTKLKKRAKSGSTRKLGDEMEAQVILTLEKASLLVTETQNSGATNFDGDLLIGCIPPDYIRAEVKYRNTEGFTVSKENWETIKKKSILHGGTPALVTINKEKEKLITMTVDDLALLLEKAVSTCKKT